MTYQQTLRWGELFLQEKGIDDAKTDAWLLLALACHTERNDYYLHMLEDIPKEQKEAYETVLKKRAEHIPLQHITGEQEFMGLPFLVNADVLIPRQDTEILVEEVMRHLSDGMRILDICTGSGCILLSLLKYSNECEGVGIDISSDALRVAQENAQRLQLDATFLEGDLFLPLKSFQSSKTSDTLFDIIVSNPPYIETKVIDTLMPEVRLHEPVSALDGGEDGLYFYRKIVAEAPRFMRKGAYLFFEIGCAQAQTVAMFMQEAGFVQIEVLKDYAGLDRVVFGMEPI